MLFELDSDPKDAAGALEWHAVEDGAEPEVRAFAEALVRGVQEHRAALDERIEAASQNWRLDQMAKVEKIILRMATYELTVARDTPLRAAINESIELAKTFSGEEAGRFVNGVLGKIVAGESR